MGKTVAIPRGLFRPRKRRGGGKIANPILTAVLVVQLSSNLVRMSNCQSVLNFWEKNQNLWWRHHYFLEEIFGTFFFYFFFLLRKWFLNIKQFFFSFLMTWLDKWQQGRTHIRHILFKLFTNLCYIKIIKVIKFGDKIFNRTKVINKKTGGGGNFATPPPPPPQNRVKVRVSSFNDCCWKILFW